MADGRDALDALPIKDTLETRFRAAQVADNLEWMLSDLDAAEKSGEVDPVNLVVLQAAYEVTKARKEAPKGAAPDLRTGQIAAFAGREGLYPWGVLT